MAEIIPWLSAIIPIRYIIRAIYSPFIKSIIDWAEALY